MDGKLKTALLPDTYLPRYFTYLIKNRFRQSIEDYRYFSSIMADPSECPFHFEENLQEQLFQPIVYRGKNGHGTAEFDQFMSDSGTTAFIVIKNDAILLEKYYNGYDEKTYSRFFSVTKSFTSALVGIALDEGLIKDTNEAVTNYVPELRTKGFNRISIKNLLNMDSGIQYDEGYFPWSRQMHQYFTSDMRKELLNLKLVDEIGSFFHYNDFHTALLGLILERVTGKPIIRYFEKKIWKPIGSESPAYLTTDSSRSGFEKMESGLTARAKDLAKFGRLFLRNGNWDGKQIVSEKWVKESTSPDNEQNFNDYFRYYNKHPWGAWFKTGQAYYKSMWWGYRLDEGAYDYFALGALGQILYISPRHNTIVVRLGKKWGIKDWWPTIMQEMIESKFNQQVQPDDKSCGAQLK